LSITPKTKNAIVQKVLFEFIYTKQAENYAPANARQAYYNNGFYKTGWEYDNRIIGTPLFINRYRAQDYLYFQNRGIKPFDWNAPNLPGNSNIVYNQIVGGNIGLLLRLTSFPEKRCLPLQVGSTRTAVLPLASIIPYRNYITLFSGR
jgi:hypothetical protein